MPSPQSICWIEILVSKASLNTTISRYSHSIFWETHVDWSEPENECYILVLLLSSGTVVIDTLLFMVISINYIITEWLFLGHKRIGRWESLENWSSLALGLESQVYHFPCDRSPTSRLSGEWETNFYLVCNSVILAFLTLMARRSPDYYSQVSFWMPCSIPWNLFLCSCDITTQF